MGAAFMSGGLAPSVVRAQAFPARPVRVIVPLPAGGSVDTITRVVMIKLSSLMGQQFFVDNRPGGAATIGTAAVANAEPDGHTLLMIFDGHAINPSLYSKLPYDSVKDFTPVGLIGYSPLILTVHTSIAVHTVAELIAFLRAKPGSLAYASIGHGTQGHLAGELFKSLAGVDMLHVPYRGGGASQNDRAAGIVQVGFSTPVIALQQISAGTVRPLALAATARIPQMPDLPTLAELGYPVEAGYWYGTVAPAGLPADVLSKLEAGYRDAIAAPEITKRLTEMGVIINHMGSAEFGAYIRAEMQRWAGTIKRLGIKVE
jgi:tripartite-type tricarboxylate transporter receptor subunit TctC